MYYLLIPILIIFVLRTESFSTIFWGVTDLQWRTTNLRKGCQNIKRQDLIDHYGSEKVLRQILLSKGLPYDIDLHANAASIADFLSGYNAHINPMFSKTC